MNDADTLIGMVDETAPLIPIRPNDLAVVETMEALTMAVGMAVSLTIGYDGEHLREFARKLLAPEIGTPCESQALAEWIDGQRRQALVDAARVWEAKDAGDHERMSRLIHTMAARPLRRLVIDPACPVIRR